MKLDSESGILAPGAFYIDAEGLARSGVTL